MGVSLDTQRKQIEEYLDKSRRVFELLYERFIRVWLYSDKLFNLTQLSKNIHDCVNYIYNFTDSVIQKRRKYLQNTDFQNQDDSVRNEKSSLDLLLELANNGNELTDKELCEHVVTFIIGGYDTTARTINFILLMLASHQDIQDKVYEEIFNIYGNEGPEKKPVKHEDLQHLKYLERVIKETMRLFPTTPIITRHVSQDLELGGEIVPKGCGIAIFILGLHRDEKIWPDPLKFDPDRFLPEAVNGRHPCAYIPFSFGSRDCIGRMYAMMSMKVFVVTFLRKYVVKKERITPIKDIKLQVDILLQTAEPISLKIEKRNL